MKKIKVLVSAYACEPGKSSEPGVGWNICRELSYKTELTVITRSNNRITIEQSGEAWVSKVSWIYWDPPHWLTACKRGFIGLQWFYVIWQIGIYRTVRDVHDVEKFDIIHHITFGKYWIPSFLSLLPAPFVFGPVGGGESSPPHLKSQGFQGRLSEALKGVFLQLVRFFPLTRHLLRKAEWTFAATDQTAERLHECGVFRVSTLHQSGFNPDEIAYNKSCPPVFGNSDTLRLVTAARLIHWKAVDIAIESFALACHNTDVNLVILHDGPDRDRLESLAKQLGVADRIEFKGRLPKLEDAHREIASADALLHPALHEAFGQACLDAISLGTPVICLDWAGPGLIIDEDTGFRITPSTRENTISAIADAIRRTPKKNETISSKCRQRAAREFGWPQLSQTILDKYKEVMRHPL